jgi:hypothetical protein
MFPIDQTVPATVEGDQQNVVLIRGPALGGVVVALTFDTPSKRFRKFAWCGW